LHFEKATRSKSRESLLEQTLGIFEARDEKAPVNQVKALAVGPFVLDIFDLKSAIGWNA
jgi:hypothetical protein